MKIMMAIYGKILHKELHTIKNGLVFIAMFLKELHQKKRKFIMALMVSVVVILLV